MAQSSQGIFAKSFDFYFTKLKQNDWRQIANIPLMLGICRQISLMGGDAGDHNFKNYINRITLVLNNFILTVDMDVKIGRGKGYWLSHVKGKCHIRAWTSSGTPINVTNGWYWMRTIRIIGGILSHQGDPSI